MTQQPSNFQQPYGQASPRQKSYTRSQLRGKRRQAPLRVKDILESYTTQLEFWCDPTDIMENQQGRVTLKQCSMLKKSLTLWPTFAFGYVTFLVTVPSVGLTFSTGQHAWLLVLIVPVVLALYTLAIFYSKRQRYSNQFPGQIESMQGEIVWDEQKKDYVVSVPMWRVTLPGSAPDLPPPGTYQFYCLGPKHLLLSAQPLINSATMSGADQSKIVRQTLQHTLSKALGFSLADLECNRRGVLSPTQYRMLASNLSTSVFGSIIALLIGAALLLLMFFNKNILDTLTIITVIIISSFMILGALFSLFSSLPGKYAEINRQTVQSIDGPVRSREDGGGSEDPSYYYYDINGKSFKVSETAYKALISELRYRVYYVATMQKILSIEPLESPWK